MSKVRLYGSTSGYIELAAPAVAPDSTLTLPPTFSGIGTNVVQTLKTDTFSASVASGAISADAITVTITPSSASSKVLVVASLSMGASGTSGYWAELYRDNAVTTYRGDAASNRVRRSVGAFGNPSRAVSISLMFLDSPATTSSVVYSVRLGHADNLSQTLYLNRSNDDTDVDDFARTASTITTIGPPA